MTARQVLKHHSHTLIRPKNSPAAVSHQLFATLQQSPRNHIWFLLVVPSKGEGGRRHCYPHNTESAKKVRKPYP